MSDIINSLYSIPRKGNSKSDSFTLFCIINNSWKFNWRNFNSKNNKKINSISAMLSFTGETVKALIEFLISLSISLAGGLAIIKSGLRAGVPAQVSALIKS